MYSNSAKGRNKKNMDKHAGKYFLQCETHSKQVSRGLCMLMERQCLVDIAICCGSSTLHGHKCVLAANSIYFKEQFENKAVEQVIINGMDFGVLKSLVEFMYCGETTVTEEHMRHFIAAVTLFKITALESVFAENEYQNLGADEVLIPPPQFICKPPKYPTVFKPFNSPSSVAPPSRLNNYTMNSNNYGQHQHKFKRKCFGAEAERACAKEAYASRVALANLRKVMANSPQCSASFIIEDSCNETTVENFIPSVEEVQYEDPPHLVVAPQLALQSKSLNISSVTTSTSGGGVLPIGGDGTAVGGGGGGGVTTLTAEKIKHILGNDQVEIMFQTSDGSYINVSDEVLLNLSKGGLQYQVVDENGQIGELQEFTSVKAAADDKTASDKGANNIRKETIITSSSSSSGNVEAIINNKSMVDTIQIRDSFNFPSSVIGMFEPENLSMRHDMDLGTLGGKYAVANADSFKGESEENCSLEMDAAKDAATAVDEAMRDGDEEAKVDKPTLFTPDMFFADTPNIQFAEDKSAERESS